MQTTNTISNIYNEGMTEAEIRDLEMQVGLTFPQAYKEFLYIGGRVANMLAASDNAVVDGEWKEMMEIAQEELSEKEIKLNNAFWVFSSYEPEQFLFYYFDEGENPPVYRYDDGNIQQVNNSFSDFINDTIDYRKTNGY
ncbi:SMI1/KNR4 family protein [Terrimonas ferruginea]|uniref:SMI1/KNR4 family protein n=1 Tax=Terrimonas ferruginea TaxID=249 RepID=UPI002480CBE2|nr:SMI1/KNR4 family protein [Terrimonas ferruginea]